MIVCNPCQPYLSSVIAFSFRFIFSHPEVPILWFPTFSRQFLHRGSKSRFIHFIFLFGTISSSSSTSSAFCNLMNLKEQKKKGFLYCYLRYPLKKSCFLNGSTILDIKFIVCTLRLRSTSQRSNPYIFCLIWRQPYCNGV